MIMAEVLSASEVVALTGLEERRVRKDVEYGVLGAARPPRFNLAEVVYFGVIAGLGFDLGVEDRKKLYELIRTALRSKNVPTRLALSDIVELKLGEIVDTLTRRRARFEAWKTKLVVDDAILGGEPVFPKSRLAVRRIGGALLNGTSVEEVKEDYPYLTDEDIEYARLYTVAYPRVGRPREAASR
jgi:uncharacterized protein (DUF433 family)